LGIYLLFTTLFDVAQARTLWLQGGRTSIAICFTVNVATKALMLLLEARGKRRYLKQEYRQLPPEATSGIISRSFLWWLNGIFYKGSRSLISVDDLYHLDQQLASVTLNQKIHDAWDSRRKPERRFEFIMAIYRALWWPFVLTAFPRICLIMFLFSQPLLIFKILDLLSREEDAPQTLNEGYGLIGAALLVYLGLSISRLHYNQNTHRFITMFRGAAISLIYNRTLAIQNRLYDESAAITLMSTDVDRIARCLEGVNECWARAIEVIVGVVLLALQLGWVCVIPIIVVICRFLSRLFLFALRRTFLTGIIGSFTGAKRIASNIGPRQKAWIEAVQKRIALTSSILADMRSVKMTGLGSTLFPIIQNQRVEETRRMTHWLWCIVWQNVVDNLPAILAPPLTFAVYAIQATANGKASIGSTQAFTSLSIMSLLTEPAAHLLSIVPQLASSLSCLDRIQKFLVAPQRHDQRQYYESENTESPLAESTQAPVEDFGMVDLSQRYDGSLAQRQSLAVIVDGIDIRPSASTDLVLHNVSFSVRQGSLTMILGPVGSGKTTLCEAILGETVLEKGSITTWTQRIAFCGQTAWLPNDTIKNVICGPEPEEDFDESWYNAVLYACALDIDLEALPGHDATQVGAGSTVLSGGQKQRVAMARALYSRAKLIILDDVLSALDLNTQRSVVGRLFSKDGLLRKIQSTVLLVTHASKYPYASRCFF
jgi:ATP-binding cassette, subfamily C (CFTR/MRP), member 1